MKKRISLIAVVAVVLAFGAGAVAKNVYENIKAQIRYDFVVEIDGTEREFKNVDGERVYPIIYDGSTYLPIRAIGEIMDKKVYWHEEEKRIELKDEKATSTTVTDADVIITEDKTQETTPKADAAYSEEGYIGKDKAKAIALEKAGLKEADVKFVKVELDRERGTVVYDVEFNQGLKEYSAEIKADDGTIVEWDVDIDD